MSRKEELEERGPEMKKLLKIIAIVLAPLVALAVLGVVVAWVYIDTLAERAVER